MSTAMPCGNYYQWMPTYPGSPYVAQYQSSGLGTAIVWPTVPTECSGDVHVFVCKKCGECKCGKAKLAKKDK